MDRVGFHAFAYMAKAVTTPRVPWVPRKNFSKPEPGTYRFSTAGKKDVLAEERARVMRECIAQGMPAPDVAKEAGVSISRVRDFAFKQGLVLVKGKPGMKARNKEGGDAAH